MTEPVPSLGARVPRRFRGTALTAAELDAAQEQAGVVFPDDLCELFTETLPVGEKFPDWRNRAEAEMRSWREWLLKMIHFDVVHAGFWLPEWGSRPENPDDSREIVAMHLTAAPATIPVYAHRAIPNEPLTAGNSVFSIWQTDIIVYGRDLDDYLVREFHRDPGRPPTALSECRPIRFWTRMLDP